ncbi:MAG TPA: hypothetical protein VKT71_11485 [Candidatus Acidoferrales bacterium]|nr:hypothetical protein [Candidatus Acidoferrales bacterium]
MGATAASVTYIAWNAFVFLRSEPQTPPAGIGFRLGFASFYWLAGGFAPALLVMILPWSLAVSGYRKLRWSGQLYFPAIGAVLVFVLGCAGASLGPTPLFVPEQTFLQGAATAAERQGIAYLLAGLVFGACYWFFGERQFPVRE